MIAISSFRPKSDCAPEIWRNQVNAKKSWERAFSRVIYFGWPPNPELASEKTLFVESEPFPKIRELCECASEQDQMTAIVNADIVVSKRMLNVEQALMRLGADSAMSKRFEFDPDNKTIPPKIVDSGLDIFIANPVVWAMAAEEVPEQFRIGHILWDTWMLSFFTHHSRCWEITEMQVIFHPKHENRIRPHEIEPRMPEDKYLHRVAWPRYALK